MARMTIDYGIDLGTTNSSIAILRGTSTRLIKNDEGSEQTPSAVHIDKNNRLIVGRAAKEVQYFDPENTAIEFKLQMGLEKEYTFLRSRKNMKPEELSAEILKTLKSDVMQKTGDDLRAAVITVPAAFELPQCEATSKAAEIAGLKGSPLVQEPVAAALTYIFSAKNNSEKLDGYWLVYDFGGGTFDTALIEIKDDTVQVINHEGDNYLGGKLIDWGIVEKILIPELVKRYPLKDFGRKNPKWRGAIAKLKLKAEEAKIKLSRVNEEIIDIDDLCLDDTGKNVEFNYTLTRQSVEEMTLPYIERTLEFCRKVLADKGFQPGNIKKILLVGGPTLMPCFRSILPDSKRGMGIPVDFTEDPLTVVAQGAAFFAGTQRIPDTGIRTVEKGKFSVELDYKPMGADTNPLVGGKVVSGSGGDMSGFTIEFINSTMKPQWRSGKINLSSQGTFMTNLETSNDNPKNDYEIVLHDPKGTKLDVEPSGFSYTLSGIVVTNPPLTHSVGIALATNEMKWFITKGSPLPSTKVVALKTAYELRKGNVDDIIRIPVMEGEHLRPDRNNRVGTLEIKATDVKRTVPINSEVEVTIEIDPSRRVRVKAFVLIIDEEFEDILNMGYEERNITVLQEDFDEEKTRLKKLQEKADKIKDDKALEILTVIQKDDIVGDGDRSLAAGHIDSDATESGKRSLKRLKVELDKVEDALEWPLLVNQADALLKTTKDIVDKHGNPGEKINMLKYEEDIRIAIESHDLELLKQRDHMLWNFFLNVLDRTGIGVIFDFEDLKKLKNDMKDKYMAENLINQGLKAITDNNIPGLRLVNKQLRSLLPTPPPPRSRKSGGLYE
jgi:molecular chaperone DnaK